MHIAKHHDTNPNLDDTLRSLDRSLDALGDAERAGVRDRLEERILRATRPVIAATRPAPRSILAQVVTWRRVALAAGVAVVAVASAISITTIRTARSAAAIAAAEQTLDQALATLDVDGGAQDSGSTSLVIAEDAFVDVRASIAAAEAALDDFWAVPDDRTDPLAIDTESTL